MSFLRRPSLRWLRSVVLGAGLGWIAGAFEAVNIAAKLRLNLDFGQLVAAGAVASACGALVAMGAGLVVGLVVQLSLRRYLDSVAYAACMAGTGFLLASFYLWPVALEIYAQGRLPAALAMAACPIGIAGVIWFNAGYWLRKEEIGLDRRVGWTLIAPAMAAGLVLLAAWIGAGKPMGSGKALEGDPNILIITVDTLRRDHVSAYGDSPAQTPNIDRLADSGVLFLDAVTPTPETAPAHASMMTSLHPLRHKVLSNGGRLLNGHTTLAERLSDEGYATGAFLSSYALRRQVGLDQGFDVYDDDYAPLRGLGQIQLARWGMRLLMFVGEPHRVPWMLERSGDRTTAIAGDWIRARGERPWFAWIHLFEPHAPYEAPDATVDHRALLSDPGHDYTEAEVAELRRLYAEEVERADAYVGRILDLLDELDLTDRTMVLLTADHGEQLGEHDLYFHHLGLWEEAVRVPLVLRVPGKRIRDTVIPQQVRLMDVAPTALAYIKLDPFEPSEGVDLTGFPLGLRKKSLACDLFGHAPAGGCLFGLRTEAEQDDGVTRVKYIADPAASRELLFDLTADPEERTDLSQKQPEAVTVGRTRVAPMRAATPCDEALSIGPVDLQMLQALGYMQAEEL
ncbi:MAG: sulfatase [Alphaproteobacteria bacterium]|nr:sulfatase [Alphaproteobacteria bacterium]